MKNIPTGTGIALLAGAIVASPIIARVMPRADAGATHAAAVVAAASAQTPPEPTIVWYDTVEMTETSANGGKAHCLYRAWSDGKVEVRRVRPMPASAAWQACDSLANEPCYSPWYVINDPAEGLTYRSDINFDSRVDSSDLAQVLNDWGNAPRHDIPPSECPLNLINP